MSAEREFEDVLFAFTVEAATAGGKAAVQQVDVGRTFHFEDTDSLRYLQDNAIQLSSSSADRLRGNLRDVIEAGLREGKPIRDVTQDVHGVFENFKGYEAERIARTEIARGVNTGAIAGYKEMGVGVAEVIANAGACPICAALNGELYPTDKAMQVLPRHPNCYCFWIPRPDMDTTNVKGWRGLGDIAREVIKGLGIESASTRVSMAKRHVRSAGTAMHLDLEEARIVVENATAGIIDKDGAICLLYDMGDGWGYIPVKTTDDAGLVALSAYKLDTKTKLHNRLERAVKTYGL